MTPSAALALLLKTLDDFHATDIVTLDVRNQTSITDHMIICNGRASRHVKAIAEECMEVLKKNGFPALHASGFENSEWVLVDFGDFVLHVLQADARAYYNIEGLWLEAGAGAS